LPVLFGDKRVDDGLLHNARIAQRLNKEFIPVESRVRNRSGERAILTIRTVNPLPTA
jgi:hypothetical protein